jgi:hypothetical protein
VYGVRGIRILSLKREIRIIFRVKWLFDVNALKRELAVNTSARSKTQFCGVTFNDRTAYHVDAGTDR